MYHEDQRIFFSGVKIGWLAQDTFDLSAVPTLPGDRLDRAQVPTFDLFSQIRQPSHIPFFDIFRRRGKIDYCETVSVCADERYMTRFRNMEIGRLKHAEIQRGRFAAPIQMSNLNSRAIDVVGENTCCRPVK